MQTTKLFTENGILKLDDETKGLACSKFQSAFWPAQSTLALQARPDLHSARIERRSGRDKCDACNRSGHPATYGLEFEDKPYDKTSLFGIRRTTQGGQRGR
ncbi:hypothetical protein VTO58DRAFT_103926 [Aureobasidium pullulans]